MQGNIKVTLSLPESTNTIAEQLRDELHISKSEVFTRAMKLLAKEQRMAKIRKACEQMASQYKTDPELALMVDFTGDYNEAV